MLAGGTSLGILTLPSAVATLGIVPLVLRLPPLALDQWLTVN